MISQIHYAAGSKAYIDGEISKYADRRMQTVESIDTADKYELYDLSDKDNVLGDSIDLIVDHAVGNDEFKGILYYQAFDLSKERDESLARVAKDILDRLSKSDNGFVNGYLTHRDDHPRTIVMLTIWKNDDDLSKWIKSSSYAPLKDFTTQRIRNFTETFKTI